MKFLSDFFKKKYLIGIICKLSQTSGDRKFLTPHCTFLYENYTKTAAMEMSQKSHFSDDVIYEQAFI